MDGDEFSKPIVARFDTPNSSSDGGAVCELYAMGHRLADTVIGLHRLRLQGRARRITIEVDPTDDATHGQY